MAEADNVKRNNTTKAAMGILGIVVLLIVVGAAFFYLLTQPGVLESTVKMVVTVAIIIAGFIGIIVIAVALIAVPMYAYKGETYQTDMDYSIEDVQSVGEKTDVDERPKV